MKTFRLALLLSAAALAAANLLYALPSGKAPLPSKIFSTRVLDANAWKIYTTNYGPFVKPQVTSGGFWRNPAHGYIYGAGLWVGAILSAGDTAVAVGYNPNSGGSEFSPPDDWWPSNEYRVYLSTDPTDLAQWPVVENGQKVIRSVQDSWCQYSDENPQFTFPGAQRLNVLVEQFSYAWNYADNNDIVFFYFKVKNISDKILNKVYLGPATDCDIGNEGGGIANDRTAFDYTRNLAMQYQTVNEVGWDKTGVVGFRYFESPINNTGDTVHVVDNQFPHSIAPGDPLGLTAFKIFSLDLCPMTDGERYLMMAGLNYWDYEPNAYDEWGAEVSADKRFLMSSGPFVLKPDSVVTTCIGIIGALDTLALKIASDVAQVIYDNNFVLAQAPAAPNLSVTPGDGRVYLSWDKTAETTPDPLWAQLPDSSAWHCYFRGTWQHLPDSAKLLVDSFEIKTGATTFARIAPGDLNPTGGTDTATAFYNQKSLYQPYDFQGYLIYRADNLEGLADPQKRCPVGTFYRSSLGAGGYFYDKADGIQIVLDTRQASYFTIDTTYYLPVYDTIGSDRGLAYGLVDEGLINGRTYYYGVSAYDYQPYACFTRKCRVSSKGDPRDNARAAVPWKKPFGYVPPQIAIRVDGGSDSRYGGALDYFRNLAAVAPGEAKRDSFKLYWGEMGKYSSGEVKYPIYKGALYSSGGSLLDSLNLLPSYSYYDSDLIQSFNGAPYDQLPFGGIVFQPFLLSRPSEALWDTVQVTGNYPKDSLWAQAYGNPNFAPSAGFWQWRGSDFEIRWRDTVVAARNCLTATVWDITNNILVPLETGVTKRNMTLSSWCFNPIANTCISYIDSAQASAYGMYICGITLYFNRRDGGAQKRMIWSLRPHTGDVWTVRCSGPTTPAQGAVATFILTPAVPDDGQPYLLQNYPNPFGCSGTNIFYQVSGSGGAVNLRIYNIAGQLVKTLVSENKAPGYYNVVWNGRTENGHKVSAGIYIYRLETAGKAITRRMVLIK